MGKKVKKNQKKRLQSIRVKLTLMNQSAVRILDEELEETLTLHHLGIVEALRKSLKITNCLESINHHLEIYTKRVCHWKHSSQRQRWVATALIELIFLCSKSEHQHYSRLPYTVTFLRRIKSFV